MSPTEVDHPDPQLLPQPIEAVGERGGGGLVDQPVGVQAGDPAGVLGRAPLIIIEISRDGHHRLRHRLAQERLGVALDLLEQERGELFG